MSIYIQQLILAFVTVYVVDISGFTDSWRGALRRLLKVRELRPLKPFDCSLCMVWWVCLLYPVFAGQFTFLTLLEAAVLSMLSRTICAVCIFLTESLNWLLDKITPR